MTIPQATEAGTWKLQSLYGYDVAGNGSYPPLTPTDLTVVDQNSATYDIPVVYNYKGYVTSVSDQPFGLKIGDSFGMQLLVYLSLDFPNSLEGQTLGTIGSSGFST